MHYQFDTLIWNWNQLVGRGGIIISTSNGGRWWWTAATVSTGAALDPAARRQWRRGTSFDGVLKDDSSNSTRGSGKIIISSNNVRRCRRTDAAVTTGAARSEAGSKMQTTPWYQLDWLFNGRWQRRHPERASVLFKRQAVEGGEEAHHHLATVAFIRFFWCRTRWHGRAAGAAGRLLDPAYNLDYAIREGGDVIFDSIECGVKFAASRDMFFYICGCCLFG